MIDQDPGESTSTKQRILDATITTLREDGLHRVSARNVATRAGVNVSLVFYHFGTVAAMVDAANAQLIAHASVHHLAALEHVTSMRELIEAAENLLGTEREAGNIVIMAQLMAAGQNDEHLSVAGRRAFESWVDGVEPVVARVTRSSVVGAFSEPRALAQAMCAAAIGVELTHGVGTQVVAFDALRSLATLVEAIDRLGPAARLAITTGVRRLR